MTVVIERFGALGVFLLMIPESACIPVPSEITLGFAGVAVHQGWMNFPLAVLAGARRVPLLAFLALTAVGCALWAAAFILAGMLIGDAWSSVGSLLGQVLLGIGLVVLAATARTKII